MLGSIIALAKCTCFALGRPLVGSTFKQEPKNRKEGADRKTFMARQLDLVGDVPDFHASGDASPDGSLAFAEREKVLSLLEAAQAGNVGAFLGAAQQFESASEISEVRDGQGRTALHFAAQLGHVELCRRLLEEFECHVDSGDDEGKAG